MGRKKDRNSGGKPPLSKYARKVAAQRTAATTKPRHRSSQKKNYEVLDAKVDAVLAAKGCMFLQSDDRKSIFLGFNTLREDCPDAFVKQGDTLKCKVVNTKRGLRAIGVVAVL